MYIMRDLNCNLQNAECPETKSLTSFCQSFNPWQLIASPTRVTDSSSSLIDVILTSQGKQVIKAGVIDCSISDHDIILRLKAPRPKVNYVKTRRFKNYNPDAFQYDMSFVPWSVLEIFNAVDDKLHAFDLLFNETLDHHAPIRSVRGQPNPCITEETRELMKSKNYWRKRARRTFNPADWSLTKTLNTK